MKPRLGGTSSLSVSELACCDMSLPNIVSFTCCGPEGISHQGFVCYGAQTADGRATKGIRAPEHPPGPHHHRGQVCCGLQGLAVL